MGKILCATRGGEASIKAQRASIELAKERGDDLIFFMAFDMEFTAHAHYNLRSDVVSEEMEEMGEFLMLMAVDRAAKAGITAEYVVKEGNFKDMLKEAIEELEITQVILGRPAEEESRFRLEGLQALAGIIEDETGVEVDILPEAERAAG